MSSFNQHLISACYWLANIFACEVRVLISLRTRKIHGTKFEELKKHLFQQWRENEKATFFFLISTLFQNCQIRFHNFFNYHRTLNPFLKYYVISFRSTSMCCNFKNMKSFLFQVNYKIIIGRKVKWKRQLKLKWESQKMDNDQLSLTISICCYIHTLTPTQKIRDGKGRACLGQRISSANFWKFRNTQFILIPIFV